MKKLLLGAVMLLLWWASFAQYSPIAADFELMDMLETKVDAMIQVDRNRTIRIANKITEVLPLFPSNTRAFYVLNGLYDYIELRVQLF